MRSSVGGRARALGAPALLSLLGAFGWIEACSPIERSFGGGAGGGGGATATTTTATTTSTTTTGGGGGGGPECTQQSDCDDSDVCTDDTCINAECQHDPIAIDDGDACTDDVCDPASGPSHPPLALDDGDACTLDLCDPLVGPSHPTSVLLFEEDFADNAAGWILGPEWQIGAAFAGNSTDPGADTSATDDNGVAGVVIGGNYSTAALHDYQYLESPAFDATATQGFVTLSFQRWIVSDYDPYLHNSVDVWDGTQWVNLWTSGTFPLINDAPPAGSGWTAVAYDVTPYANAAMKVRFGFDITNAGVFPAAGWSLDDVRVENTAFATDGDLCTIDVCDGLAEPPVSFVPLGLDDSVLCTHDICDPARGIRHEYFSSGPYLYETFANNGAGWTLGTEWAIGAAKASSGHSANCGNGDPATDNTPTADNGVAGVAIGANASLVVHDFYYLTSPPFNTTDADNWGLPITLQFYRWLNSDMPPHMVNVVDVWDGTQWVNLWTQPADNLFITDAAWTLFQYDVTPYSNAAMQVRFGFKVGAGAFLCSQWNLDDISVVSGCP